MAEKNISKLTVEVDRELFKRFKAKCTLEEKKIVEVITQAIKDYLKEN